MYFPGSSGFYKKQMIGNYGSSDCFRCCHDSSLVSSCLSSLHIMVLLQTGDNVVQYAENSCYYPLDNATMICQKKDNATMICQKKDNATMSLRQ